MNDWLWILLGLVALIAGAEFLVRGSAWIATALGVRQMIVGLTVVAIGTSAPELTISVSGALKGETGIVLGGVYGSNVANIALILGITTLIAPICIREAKIRYETMWLLGATLVTLLPLQLGEYGRALGILMTCGIAYFVYTLVQRARKDRPEPIHHNPIDRSGSQWALHIVFIPLGLVGLIYGGGWLVEGASNVAKALGWSDVLIGCTIVAIGTSAPELATAIMAARKNHSELVLGNILGSNIFNILMVIGVTATISPLEVTAKLRMHTLFGLALAVVLAMVLLGPRRMPRLLGVGFLIAYATYLGLEFAASTAGA